MQEQTQTPTVVLLGTLDTKGIEYGFVRDRLRALGVAVLVIDAGVMGEPAFAGDIPRDDVARAAGSSVASLVEAGDRGDAIDVMGRGAAAVVMRLQGEGRLDGILGLGGSGGSTLFARAVRDLPVGVPKLLVSTVASGDTRGYVGATDLTMMYSVVDIAGINTLSRRILGNAAGAIAGMAREYARPAEQAEGRPLIGATMFGVTTPAVTAARERLEDLGYEVLVFHATGTGGDTMEALLRSGILTGVVDITTTEFADLLVGGNLPAGPDRLVAAGAMGLPQVVSLGAMDMVNFGPKESVPERFGDRNLLVHNSQITLMRTTPEENARLGHHIAEKLNAVTGPLTVFIPRGGVSSVDVPGQPFHDPAADAALFDSLRATLRPDVSVIEMDTDLNDPAFARAMADTFHEQYQHWRASQATGEGQ